MWLNDFSTLIDMHLSNMFDQSLHMRKGWHTFLQTYTPSPQANIFGFIGWLICIMRLYVTRSFGDTMIETIHWIFKLPVAFGPTTFEYLKGKIENIPSVSDHFVNWCEAHVLNRKLKVCWERK